MSVIVDIIETIPRIIAVLQPVMDKIDDLKLLSEVLLIDEVNKKYAWSKDLYTILQLFINDTKQCWDCLKLQQSNYRLIDLQDTFGTIKNLCNAILDIDKEDSKNKLRLDIFFNSFARETDQFHKLMTSVLALNKLKCTP